MQTITLKVGTEKEFFERGRQLAHLADQGGAIPEEQIVSFEDPADLLRLLSESRLNVFRVVKEAPASITDIALRLRRDRSAVKRDVDQLEHAGMVTVQSVVLPGHGRMKQIRASAHSIRLEATVC